MIIFIHTWRTFAAIDVILRHLFSSLCRVFHSVVHFLSPPPPPPSSSSSPSLSPKLLNHRLFFVILFLRRCRQPRRHKRDWISISFIGFIKWEREERKTWFTGYLSLSLSLPLPLHRDADHGFDTRGRLWAEGPARDGSGGRHIRRATQNGTKKWRIQIDEINTQFCVDDELLKKNPNNARVIYFVSGLFTNQNKKRIKKTKRKNPPGSNRN